LGNFQRGKNSRRERKRNKLLKNKYYIVIFILYKSIFMKLVYIQDKFLTIFKALTIFLGNIMMLQIKIVIKNKNFV